MDRSRSDAGDRDRDGGLFDSDADGATYGGPGGALDRTEAVANDADHRAFGSYTNDNTAAGRGAVPAGGMVGTDENVVYVESEGSVARSAADSVGMGGAIDDRSGSFGMQAGATAAEALGLAGHGSGSRTEGIGLANERLETTGAVRTGATVGAGETIAVPVHEEELSATKTSHQTGQVRIEKDVVAEERVLEVPVTEERVRVQRRVVDRAVAAADGDVFEEAVIDVPVYGEDVQLHKTVRVAEEVEVSKEAVQRTEQVAGTVRREEVRIEDNVSVGAEGVIDDTTAVIDPSIGNSGTGRGSGSGASNY